MINNSGGLRCPGINRNNNGSKLTNINDLKNSLLGITHVPTVEKLLTNTN